jgi:periplasmic protein CpxP/Spy
MKFMSAHIKRTIVICTCIVGIAMLLSTLAQAQQQRMSVENHVKILKDSLMLNDAQTTAITKLLADQRIKMDTAMNESRGDHKAMRAAMQEIMKNTDSQIKAILTAEQTKKYDEMLNEHRMRMGRRTK